MSQVYNPTTQMFIKKDKAGKFVASKDTPYKNLQLATGSKTVKSSNAAKGVKDNGKGQK
jgi:hypothetical protein